MLGNIHLSQMSKSILMDAIQSLRLALAGAALGVVLHSAQAGPPPSTNSEPSSELVEFDGNVETTRADTNEWRAAQPHQILHPGDRLRTAADSRATLQLSDRSVLRVGPSTIIEIQPPTEPARHRFNLRRGALFFFDREKPSDVEFETPLATGAIRGTEFFLAVDPSNAATRLALLDGAVILKTAEGKLPVTSGQQVLVETGHPMQLSAVLPVANLIQWSFYYPAVLNLADIRFTATEKSALATSLSAYASGDLLKALATVPAESHAETAATRTYMAALRLAVGQVQQAEILIPPTGELAAPLRELIASVTFKTLPVTAPPTNSSGWLARSYYLQSRSQLPGALQAARQAVKLDPGFGFAWARLAELEFGFERWSETRAALDQALRLSPRDAQAVAIEGYLALAQNDPRKAVAWFNRALALDGSLPSAWLGRGLAEGQLGQNGMAARDLQVAATLEPQRGLFRSYLGKAWSEAGADQLAEKEFALAKQLDPSDPTAWLYSALHRFQTHQINDAVRDLEHSEDLNDNRSIFRSRLLLDRDRATRSADLAAIYDTAGLAEVSQAAASRAVEDSYSDFAGHLFLSDSLASQETPQRFDLRLETARESELLVANLLAPPGGGNLSQLLSQQDHLRYFGTHPFGFSSLVEYDGRGDWNQSATAFGDLDGFSYALDAQHVYLNGQRSNNDLEDYQLSLQVKQQITPADSAYFQVSCFHGANGDVAQHYDPTSAIQGFRVTEEQNPNFFAGWNHEWSPGSHLLFLFSRLTDHLSLTNPQPSVLFMQQDGSGVIGVEADPYFSLQQVQDFTLYSAEAQQIWETPEQTILVGGRYQRGTVDTHSTITRLFGAVTDQSAAPYLQRINGYGYYQWRPVARLHVIAGLSYDQLSYPRNIDLPPIMNGENGRSVLGPKLGFTAQPWSGGWLHGAWTRSLGGLFFDNSIRLEPAQFAGSTSAYRELIPESTQGLVPGTKVDAWTLGFDQALKSGTYFGVSAEWLASDGSRDVGAFTNSIAFIPVPDGPTVTRQTLQFRERNLSAYASQLLGRDWSVGARYRLSEAKLGTRLPALGGVSGTSSLDENNRAVLQHAQFFAIYNLPCGFFAEWSSDWYHQDNHGYTPGLPGDDFWQHNVYAGYVFGHRRAELRLGLLNLTDQDYRLNPLNLQSELARGRTFTASLRLNF